MSATPRSDEAPRPIAVSEMTRPDTADSWLIDGFIRPAKLAVLGATEGVGKSWLVRELAMLAAAGVGSVLGRYAVVEAVRVLVIDEDNGEDEEWRRDEALFAHLGLRRAQLGDLFRVSFAGVLLDDPEWQRQLTGWIDDLKIRLLILDPVSMMYRAKELREELLPVITFLRSLLRRFPGLSILAVHHLRKPPAGQPQAERLLTDLRGAMWGQVADAVALLWPIEGGRVRLQMHKRVPRSDHILEQTAAGPFVWVADGTSRARRVTTDDRVLASIDAGATNVDEIIIATDIPKRTVWNAVKRLRMSGIIEPQGALHRVRDGAA
jgi:AAA domain